MHRVITILGIKIKFFTQQKLLKKIFKYIKREKPSKYDYRYAKSLKLAMIKIAAEESAQFVIKNCISAPVIKDKPTLVSYALNQVDVDGMYMEFGVYKGYSINRIAKEIPDKTVYGFDSFEGLPETWIRKFKKGHFSMDGLPPVEENVKLIKGWYNDTLPGFIQEHGDFKIAFLHSDSDLYSSTKTTLEYLKDHFQDGSVIVFDEYFNYAGWQEHEHKAFCEFLDETGYKVEYLGYCDSKCPLAVRLRKN